jgi:glycosyltransferase involved in cell wall biosynthesis
VIYVVHGRLHAFPAVTAGKWLGKPVLVRPGRGGEAHFDLSVVQRKRLLGPFFARGIARNTTAWVANTREIVADLSRWGVPRERVHAIPNGIDIPEDGRRQRSNGLVRFLSMGRLDFEKRVDQTIRAFASLPVDAPAQLTILGDGLCRPELEALSRRLGQEGRIVFTGAVGDVMPYLNEADVYVSTSVSEGMSNALLEAMSNGVMPVVSQVSGVDELVEEGVTGFLFPPGDETAVANRLEKSLAMTVEERRATGEAARDAIRARFSLEKVAERHLALYRQLTGAGPCAKA